MSQLQMGDKVRIHYVGTVVAVQGPVVVVDWGEGKGCRTYAAEELEKIEPEPTMPCHICGLVGTHYPTCRFHP